MALDFVVEFCVREAKGELTMRVRPMVDGQPWEKSIEAQGATAALLEADLRPKLLAAKQKYDSMLSLKAVAQQRLDVLKSELGITGA